MANIDENSTFENRMFLLGIVTFICGFLGYTLTGMYIGGFNIGVGGSPGILGHFTDLMPYLSLILIIIGVILIIWGILRVKPASNP